MRAFIAVALLSAASVAYADPSSATKVDVLAGGSLGSGVSGLTGPGVGPGSFTGVGAVGGSSGFPSVPSFGSPVRGLPRALPGSSRISSSGSSASVGVGAVPGGRPGFSGFRGFAQVGGFYGPSGFGGGFNNGPAFYPGYHGFGDYDNCFGFEGYYDGGFHPYYGFGYGSGLGYGGFGGNYGGPFGGSYGFPGSFGQVGDQRATGFPFLSGVSSSTRGSSASPSSATASSRSSGSTSSSQ